MKDRILVVEKISAVILLITLLSKLRTLSFLVPQFQDVIHIYSFVIVLFRFRTYWSHRPFSESHMGLHRRIYICPHRMFWYGYLSNTFCG
jgi:hypothetical protein